MTTRTEIIKYMKANIGDHVDPLTGEVNDTGLAEDVYWHFHLDPDDNEIPEYYFDLALKVADKYEIDTGVRTPLIGRGVSGIINTLPSDFF